MTDEKVRVAIYFHDDAQRDLAADALEDPVTFANVVEGETTPDRLAHIAASDLVFEVLPKVASGAMLPESVIPAELLEDLANRANVNPVPYRPKVEEAPEEDVYRVELRGPITREQRMELSSLEVDIIAFEPPDRYRMFLTHKQYARVLELPYVEDITHYGLEDTLTPELVDFLALQTAPGPELAGDRGERPVLDCLLHRERDVARVRALIEAADGTKVLGTSNLRIRFSAPADASLIPELAMMAEVAKLAPFEAPTL